MGLPPRVTQTPANRDRYDTEDDLLGAFLEVAVDRFERTVGPETGDGRSRVPECVPVTVNGATDGRTTTDRENAAVP